MLVKEIVFFGEKKLSKISDMPKLEVLILLEYLLGIEREKLLAYPEKEISDDNVKKFYDIINKRVDENTPLSYLIKEKEFYSLKFYVNEYVLIPRPETEKIVEMSIEILKNRIKPKVLDIGTGSGNIITAISFYYPDEAVYYASDISYEAIKIAKTNAEKYNQNIFFFLSDLFSGIKEQKIFDLIVSNPPYVSEEEYYNLDEQVLKEPKIALLAKNQGLYYINKIINYVKNYLKDTGKMIIEVGDSQASKIKESYSLQKNIEIIKDDFGKERFILYSPVL